MYNLLFLHGAIRYCEEAHAYGNLYVVESAWQYSRTNIFCSRCKKIFQGVTVADINPGAVSCIMYGSYAILRRTFLPLAQIN